MQNKSLRPDATLRDLTDGAEEFVRRALEVMWAQKPNTGVTLRLGITGLGKRPNYRLEREGITYMALDGNNHKPWPTGENFGGPVNWSVAVMSLREVQELRRDLNLASRSA